ncbi:MAG TPA: class I SAM-dependent methyltransferase [Candidatus Limnocylindria bacterium]|nr:class I SAM-dependent methyltransferase [Candidatus Limnocylindria bacterium]
MSRGSQRQPPTADDLDAVRQSFDAMAEAYARAFADELSRKPFDRDRLDELAAATRPDGRVLDLGTGAGGQIGRYLADQGFNVTGVDFSDRSIEIARRLNPGMTFEVADIRSLPFADDSIAAISAFYCLIYGTDDDVLAALRECRRVLEPGGRLLASVHGGEGVKHFDDFRGVPVDISMRHTSPEALRALAERAGLTVDDVAARGPYPDEHATLRIYLTAHA